MVFCKEFNAKTQDRVGDILPVEIYVYSDKSFEFITKQPPVSRLILKAAGVEKGSKVPNRDKVAKLTKADVDKIIKQKYPDMRVNSLEAAAKLVEGTARSMGVEVGA
jgi:large subunit ribosomal protein L11